VTPIREPETTAYERGGPQKGRPNARVPARTNVTAMVTDVVGVASDDVARLLALSDEGDLHLRLRLAAWREGYAAARSELEEALLHAFADGWTRRGEYEAERGRAA
jgi:hypothetical protein